MMNEKEQMQLLRQKAKDYHNAIGTDSFYEAQKAAEKMYGMLSPLVVISLVDAWLEVETEDRK